MLGQDSKLDLAFLNVKHRVRGIALLEHVLILVKFEDRFPKSDFGEKDLRVKLVISWLSHRSLLWLDERHLISSHLIGASIQHPFVARLRLPAFHTTRGIFAKKVA